MEKALVSLEDTMQLGDVLAKSGYFTDARQAAQAVVKVLAGREIGFGPIASMTGIYIVKGRVSLGASLMAAAVKRHGGYDYRVIKHDESGCEIAFYQGEEELGRSVFTMKDAQQAGLATGPNSHSWRHYPRNMLFARAMSNGVKWFCPDVSYGVPMYTPEELGMAVDGETGEIIEGEAVTVSRPPEPEAPPSQPVPEAESGTEAGPLVEPEATTEAGPQGDFDPDRPGFFTSYAEVYQRAVEFLGYSHVNHAKNALKKVVGGTKDDLTHQVAWQLLKEHQESKAGAGAESEAEADSNPGMDTGDYEIPF